MDKQDMEKIMETLKIMLANNQEQIDANTKTMLAEMQEMKANQAKMDANLKFMRQEMNAGHKEIMAWLKDLKINGEETMTCQEKTEVRLEEEEPTSVEMKPEVAHEEVPLEDAVVMPVGEPRKRRRDQRHLAAQRRQKKEEERTQSKNECRKDLVAARRGTTRRATVAWRKRNIERKSWTQRNCGLRKQVTAAEIRVTRRAGVARHKRGFAMGRNRIRRREPKNERSKGPRSRYIEELLHLRKGRKTANGIGGRNRRLQPRLETMRNSNEVFGKSIGQGFGKRAAGSPVAVRKIENWTLWRGRPPPKRKKQQN
jgi:hypothetical protein